MNSRQPGDYDQNKTDFVIKDSGARQEFDSGMVRDTEEGKTDYALITDGPMFERWAVHLTKGAVKYAARNWMKASSVAELVRFRASAFRHFMQWFFGAWDEDHAAAVYFNINGAEYVKLRLSSAARQKDDADDAANQHDDHHRALAELDRQGELDHGEDGYVVYDPEQFGPPPPEAALPWGVVGHDRGYPAEGDSSAPYTGEAPHA